MKTVAALLLALAASTSAMACDKVDAAKMQFILSEMGAQWSEQHGKLNFHWGREWDGAGRSQRLGLLRTVAQGDACLAGQAREISFYRNGQLVATASPAAGIQLVSDSASASAMLRRQHSPACQD